MNHSMNKQKKKNGAILPQLQAESLERKTKNLTFSISGGALGGQCDPEGGLLSPRSGSDLFQPGGRVTEGNEVIPQPANASTRYVLATRTTNIFL